MNMKELVSTVTAETNLPASEVRKVISATLSHFAQLIETQGRFSSSQITLVGVEQPARPASDDQQARPARKFARMKVRVKEQADESEAADESAAVSQTPEAQPQEPVAHKSAPLLSTAALKPPRSQ